jgi:thiol-disulfide isomerase/thioredoxin
MLYFCRCDSRLLLSSALIAVGLSLLGACGGNETARSGPAPSTPAIDSNLPRTSVPMPPVATGHGKLTNAQTFTLLNDQQRHLTQYLGQVVVLDFWATYCPPCLEEAPHLDSLQKQYGAQGLQVIGLNVGGPDDRGKVPQFARQLSIGYSLGFPEPEMNSFYMQNDDRIPQTFVFNRQGRMVKHYVGFNDEIKADMDAVIKRSLAEETTNSGK